MASQPLPTRDRIVDAAAKLFYANGIRAVSVDAVAEKAGVTKKTLYYHFASKDDLIAAYLGGRDQPNLAAFARWFDGSPGDVADRTQAIFTKLARAASRRDWQGCGFLRTSAELANLPGHPALVIGRAHKKKFEAWMAERLAAADIAGAEALARQILVLLDGAFATMLLHRDPGYIEAAGTAAAALVRLNLAGGKSSAS